MAATASSGAAIPSTVPIFEGADYFDGNCSETPASVAVTLQRVVVDRLSLETGCAKEQIKVVSQSDWSRGTERAYRLEACGKAFICATANNGTDCKAALSGASSN